MTILYPLGVGAAFFLCGFLFAAGAECFARLRKHSPPRADTQKGADPEARKEHIPQDLAVWLAQNGYLPPPGHPPIAKQWAEFNHYDGSVR